MGYRNYLGSITKKEYNKIKKFTKEELFAYKNEDINDGWVGPYQLVTQVYEYGKYCEFPTEGLLKPFFKNKELQKWIESDEEFFVITKEFVKMTIDDYKNKIRKYYGDMVSPFLGDKDDPCEFMNSIKRDSSVVHGEIVEKYSFDFSKITNEQQKALFNIFEHMRSFRHEWYLCYNPDNGPYDLEKGDAVTTSWKYEYEIFELVRIYKHFDWKKNVMVYYGY